MPEGASLPALLVSYVYVSRFVAIKHTYDFRDWALDSGAFSAHTLGKKIENLAYIEFALQLRAEDPTLSDIFALDVIDDYKAGLKNAQAAWDHGLAAIPCYHFGEPWEYLRDLAQLAPKIAIGGAVGMRLQQKDAWASKCFAQVWPKRIHGFGFGSETSLLRNPFDSVDASNWESAPCRWGHWKAYGALDVRGSRQHLRAEIAWYLELERRARHRWAPQMAEIGAVASPVVRLALASSRRTRSRLAFGKEQE
jgi:hypothetical protein